MAYKLAGLNDDAKASKASIPQFAATIIMCTELLSSAVKVSFSSNFESLDPDALYKRLIECAICRNCNDVSLCLREIKKEQLSLHPDNFARHELNIQKALGSCASVLAAPKKLSRDVQMRLNRVSGSYGIYNIKYNGQWLLLRGGEQINAPLALWRDLLQKSLMELNLKFFKCSSSHGFEVDMQDLSLFFLEFAVSVESYLGRFGQSKDKILDAEIGQVARILQNTRI